MGVQGLWKLLAPCGRRISVETLEHTTLAIDVSIWLTQFVKAMRDDEGRPIRNAHLIGTRFGHRCGPHGSTCADIRTRGVKLSGGRQGHTSGWTTS